MGGSTPWWCATSSARARPPKLPIWRSARGEARPLSGIPMTVKESFNVAGLPTTWGIPGFKDFVATEDALIVSAAQGGGRGHCRQDQCADRAGRLAELQRNLRHHQQSLGPRPHAGRIFRWIGGGAGRRLRAARARFRHRRLAARAGPLLRRLRPQADLGSGAGAGAHAAGRHALVARGRSCRGWPNGQERRRSAPGHGGDCRPRRTARRHRLPPRPAGAPPRRAQGLPCPRHRRASRCCRPPA